MLENHPAVLIVIAILVAIAVALAIWRGRGLEIGKWYVRVKPADAMKGTTVSVGEKLKMSGAKIGGDVAGIKKSGGDVSQDVDVLRDAEVKDTQISGDITGFRQENDGKK
jgi:hypothetical protein